MVRTYQRKYSNTRNGKSHLPYLSYSKEDLNKAIEAVQNHSLRLKEAAENYNIPISTLSRKCRNINCTQEKAGHPTLFSVEEEKSFVEYIQVMSKWGFPLDSTDLQKFAQMYLNKIGKKIYGLTDNMPGVDWARNFLIRHKSEISNRSASNISSDRAKTTPQMIDQFFVNYEKSVEGVSPDCIINYDETNLTDDPGSKKYIFKRGSKYPERIMNSSKTSISLMFSGTADGQSLPIYVVYKADHMWDQWVLGGPDGTRYNRSKSGWFDSVCFEDWFHTIIVPYAKKKPGRKVLIGDNLSSHFSQSVLQTCNELNIAFICLPPKTTHLLQPLDVALYAPLKKYWRDVLTKWKMTEGLKHKTLVKSSFPKLLRKLKKKLEENGKESNNLIAGFNKCGLYPINSERPKSRLPQREVISEEQIEKTTSSVVMDMLQQMRSPSSATGPTNRKKKCHVPPGMSITADDLVGNQTEKAKPQQKRKNTEKQKSRQKKNRKSLNKDRNNTDSEISGGIENEESNLLDTQPIACPSGLCKGKAFAYDSDSTNVSSDDQRLQQEKIRETSKKPEIGEYTSIKGKGKGKKSKPKIDKKEIEIRDLKKELPSGENLCIKGKNTGKKSRPKKEKRQIKISDIKNLDLDPESIKLLIASIKSENSKNKKTKTKSRDSDTTSVSDIMSIHSDSDLLDVDLDENGSDFSESCECNEETRDQPTASENIQIPDHDDKLIARSDCNLKTDNNTKLEYVTDKTGNNPSNSATPCVNRKDEPRIPQSPRDCHQIHFKKQKDIPSQVHEFSFSNEGPTDTKDLQNCDVKDCKVSSVKCYVTAGSTKQNTDDSLKTDLEYGAYNIDEYKITSATLCEKTGVLSQTHESVDSKKANVYPLPIEKIFEPDLDGINCDENNQNYNNMSQEQVKSDQKINEHTIESLYAMNDHVLVRYCNDRKYNKYYVGFIENIKIDERKYTINFYKTIKKPQLAFRINKIIDRDEVDDIWIVKKIVMIKNPIKAKEFLLADKNDELYF